MKRTSIGSWIALTIGALYFIVPLVATFEFSLRLKRGVYSFEAYRIVLGDPAFQRTFGYSTVVALATIAVGVLLVVPTAYWIQLRLRWMRPVVEFITLLPLVIPAIVIVFGYLRIYNSSSWLPFTSSARATDVLLTCGYVTLALPYMYRAVDTGLRAIDVRTLTEAAESLGARWPTILFRVIFPTCEAPFFPAPSSPSRSSSASSRSRACSIVRRSGLICSSSAPTVPMSLRRWRSSPSS
jgi:putative spermidine/putrescine transport system permease protein